MPLQHVQNRTEITTRFQELEARPVVDEIPNMTMAKRRANWLVSAANMLGGEAGEALSALIRRGPSVSFLEEIYDSLGDVKQCSRLELDKKRRRFIWVPDQNQQSLRIVTQLCLVSIINAGLSKRIKRCANSECRMFFFGDLRRKWCSDGCGSLIRVRDKRKLDKQRQML